MVTAFARGAAVAFGLSALSWAVPASGQIPESFSNLQVLDADIDRGELVGLMRSFAGALGVRCNHCHVGPDNLQGMDFATDEKDSKKSARQMMRMVRHINGEVLTDLPVASGRVNEQVTCYTCHRGLTTPPRSSRDVLLEAIEGGGVDAGVAKLEDLVERHAMAGIYNLAPANLASVGRILAERGRPEEAVAWLERMAPRYPENADLPATLGTVLHQAGKGEAALRAFDRALEIDPDHPWVSAARDRVQP